MPDGLRRRLCGFTSVAVNFLWMQDQIEWQIEWQTVLAGARTAPVGAGVGLCFAWSCV